jgi:hypothetical protein
VEIPRIIGGRLELKAEILSPIDLMIIVAGHYANAKKKFDRGDTPKEQFVPQAETLIGAWQLAICCIADEYNLDLEAAVIEKFNLVSDRIGCGVKL